jgi:copper chaperone CopZ
MKAILSIEGMSCEHCVKRVKLALEENFSEAQVEVNLASNSATLMVNEQLDKTKVAHIIDDAGYTLTNITYQE